MSKTVVIYDGDLLAYRAAAATEERSVLIKHVASGKEKVFNTRTEHKKALLLKGKEFNKTDWEFSDIQEPQPLANTLAIVKNKIQNMNDALFADDYIVCLSGKNNFRDKLLLPTKYKGSREGTNKPLNLKEVKHYLWKNHPSILANNREADDDQIIKGYEYINKGYTAIISIAEKDAFAYSGLHLIGVNQEISDLRLIPEFGSLWDTGKKITGEGFLWYCFQVVNGDTADSYKPSELAKVKFGEQSAFKLLKDCADQKHALETVKAKYKEWYPEPFEYTAWNGELVQADYRSMIDLYHKCARMMTTEDDNLCSKKFFSGYGVELD